MLWVLGLGGLAVAVWVLLIWGRVETAKWRKSLADGSYAQQFDYVDDDGSARELELDQIEHLSTEYQGADGARPYIKSNYGSLTPDGRISGYLKRSKLPRRVRVIIR